LPLLSEVPFAFTLLFTVSALAGAVAI